MSNRQPPPYATDERQTLRIKLPFALLRSVHKRSQHKLTEPHRETDIRQKAKQGSIYLVVRRGFDVVFGAFGLLFLTRLVGPHGYGLFAAAFSLVRFITLLSESGVKMYLIRSKRDTPREIFHQAFWWLLLSGVLLSALSIGGMTLFRWLRGDPDGFTLVATIMLASIPVTVLSGVPQALLERELHYKQVSFVEIMSQTIYYIVGILLAMAGYGVWAFVGAFWAGQITLFTGYYLTSQYHPRWYWNSSAWKDLTYESFKLAAASWVYELRLLGPSLILLPLAGATATGYYALAQRLFNTLGFMRDAIARLAVPVYAHVQEETEQLLQAAYRSAQAQILVSGIPYLIFTVAGYLILPIIFGNKWNITIVILIFFILSSNNLFFVIFGAQNQVLLVLRQSHVFLKSGILYVIISFGISALLTMLAPEPFRVVGYTVGTVLAYIPYYFSMDRGIRRYVGTPRYGTNLLWAGGISLALLASVINGWLLLGLLVLLSPFSRMEIRYLVHELHRIRSHVPRGHGSPG